jgi:hypothetical protein
VLAERGTLVSKIPAPEELSENAQLLLGFLGLHSKRSKRFSRIAYMPDRANPYVIVPYPSFNLDPKTETRFIYHPECLEELISHGLMIYREYKTKSGIKNIYALTQRGKSISLKIIAKN